MADNMMPNTSYTKEEQERIAKIDRLDSDTGRKKLILAAVTVALVLIFVLGTVIGGKYILSYEGTEALPETYLDYSADPLAIESLFTGMLEEVLTNDHIKCDRSVSVGMDKDSIAAGDDSVKNYVSYIRSEWEDRLEDVYADFEHTGVYGEDCFDVLPEIYFSESLCRFTLEESEDNPEELKLKSTYDVAARNSLENMFLFNKDEAIAGNLQGAFAGIMQIENPVFTLAEISTETLIDRSQSPFLMKSFTLTKVYNVTLTGIFTDENGEAYSSDISFKLTVNNRYQFTRVTFCFNDDVIYIAKGDTGEFKYTLVTDESPAETVITFVSENTDAVSIDKYGYYKGHIVSETPVVVTGTYTYLGKTYTDTIEVLVRTELEDVKLETKELSLTVGQTKVMNMTFKPEDATVKDVYWFTEDENIAAVNEKGEITAKAVGEVKVYLISADGNFKRGVTVTVIEEGGTDNG